MTVEGVSSANGMATAVTQLAAQLSTSHSVTLVHVGAAVQQDSGHWKYVFNSAGLRYEAVHVRPGDFTGTSAQAHSFVAYRWLQGNSERCWAIHFHDFKGIGAYTALAKAAGSHFSGTPIIVQGHGSSTLFAEAQGAEVAHDDAALEGAAIQAADVLAVPSRFYRDYLAHSLALALPRTELLPNVVASEEGYAQPLQCSPRRTLAFFGRQTRAKGLLHFLALATRLCGPALPCPFTAVLIMGSPSHIDGQLSTALVHAACEQLTVPCEVIEQVNTLSAMRRLQAADALLVLPSRVDIAPQVVVEATLAGVPLLASAAGDIPELLQPSSAARLFPPDHLPGMASLAAAAAAQPCWVPQELRHGALARLTAWQQFYGSSLPQQQHEAAAGRGDGDGDGDGGGVVVVVSEGAAQVCAGVARGGCLQMFTALAEASLRGVAASQPQGGHAQPAASEVVLVAPSRILSSARAEFGGRPGVLKVVGSGAELRQELETVPTSWPIVMLQIGDVLAPGALARLVASSQPGVIVAGSAVKVQASATTLLPLPPSLPASLRRDVCGSGAKAVPGDVFRSWLRENDLQAVLHPWWLCLHAASAAASGKVSVTVHPDVATHRTAPLPAPPSHSTQLALRTIIVPEMQAVARLHPHLQPDVQAVVAALLKVQSEPTSATAATAHRRLQQDYASDGYASSCVAGDGDSYVDGDGYVEACQAEHRPVAALAASFPQTHHALRITANFSSPVSGVNASTFLVTLQPSPASPPTLSVLALEEEGGAVAGDQAAAWRTWLLVVELQGEVAAVNASVAVVEAAPGVQPPNAGSIAPLHVRYLPPLASLSWSSPQAAQVEAVDAGIAAQLASRAGVVRYNKVTVTASFSSPVSGITAASLLAASNSSSLQVAAAAPGSTSGDASTQHSFEVTLRRPLTASALNFTLDMATISPRSVLPAPLYLAYEPTFVQLSSGMGVNTSDLALAFTATFSSPVIGLTAAAFTVSTGLDVRGRQLRGAGRVYTLVVQLSPSGATSPRQVTVSLPPTSPGVIPAFSTARTGPVTVRFIPPGVRFSHVMNATSPGFTLVATFATAVTGVTAESFGLRPGQVVRGATQQLLPSSGGATYFLRVSLPASLHAADFEVRLRGSSLQPPLANVTGYVVKYRCSLGKLACATRHIVKLAPAHVAMNASVAALHDVAGPVQWSLLLAPPGAASAPQLSAATVSPTLTVPGRYAIVARVSNGLGYFHEVMWRVEVVNLMLIAPASAFAGSALTLRWTGYLPPGTWLRPSIATSSSQTPHRFSAVLFSDRSSRLQIPQGMLGAANLTLAPLTSHALAAMPNASATLTRTSQLPLQPSYSGTIGSWGPCSASCGSGLQRRQLLCHLVTSQPHRQVSVAKCWPGTTPATSQPCDSGTPCAQPQWQVGDWSACSKDCGWGTSSRVVQCLSSDGSSVVADSACPRPQPASLRPCNSFPCQASFGWVAGAWGRCSVECGQGVQRRVVRCLSQRTLQADASQCSSQPQPAATRSCERSSCAMPYFTTGPWSACSERCGSSGVATREVRCHDNGTTTVVTPGSFPASACATVTSPPIAPPVAQRKCNRSPCYTLRVGQLSPCSAECGGGTQSRSVQCVSTVNGTQVPLHLCSHLQTPPTQVQCNPQPCQQRPFCSRPSTDCGQRGRCDVGVQKCVCQEGSHGARCELLDDCDGVPLADGGCCEAPGVLYTPPAAGSDSSPPRATCCESGVVSSEGVCCAIPGAGAATLDACGRCSSTLDQPVVRGLDGTCCAADQLAGDFMCCAGEVDACGVCDGVNMCSIQQVAAVSSLHATVEELLATSAVSDFITQLREALQLDPDQVNVLSEWATAPARRLEGGNARRLASFTATTTLVPLSSGLDPGLAADLAFTSQSIPIEGAVIQSVSAATALPECGNGACEMGEVCGATDEDCCLLDCPTRRLPCPTMQGATAACSSAGSCDYLTGTCRCYTLLGATGLDCSSCSEGYTAINGRCSARDLQEDPSTVSTDRPFDARILGLAGAGVIILLGVLACVVARAKKGSSEVHPLTFSVSPSMREAPRKHKHKHKHKHKRRRSSEDKGKQEQPRDGKPPAKAVLKKQEAAVTGFDEDSDEDAEIQVERSNSSVKRGSVASQAVEGRRKSRSGSTSSHGEPRRRSRSSSAGILPDNLVDSGLVMSLSAPAGGGRPRVVGHHPYRPPAAAAFDFDSDSDSDEDDRRSAPRSVAAAFDDDDSD